MDEKLRIWIYRQRVNRHNGTLTQEQIDLLDSIGFDWEGRNLEWQKESLAEKNPALAEEWNESRNGNLSPSEVTIFSGRTVWWQCEKGHEWEERIANRATKKTGCPYCSGKKVLSGFNDLATEMPSLAAEWHPTKNGSLKPSEVLPRGNRKVWWQCEKGHEWEASIIARVHGSKCIYCVRQKPVKGENDLASTYPEIAAEWHPSKNAPYSPSDFLPRSNRKVWWKCKNGHEWQAIIGSRTKSGYGCPVCSNHKVLIGYNDLASKYPTLAAEWHPTKNGKLKPADISYGYSRKVWWQCNKGHEWEEIIGARIKGNGCPYCSNRRLLHGYNDLATKYPLLSAEWNTEKNDGLTPSDIKCSNRQKYWWKCSKGHEWQTTIAHRLEGTGCPYCSNRKIIPGYNDLATKNPAIAAEWHPTKNGSLKPTEVSYGSGMRVWWKCSKGHEWDATVSKRTNGRGCPMCAAEKKKKGENK